MAPTAFIRRASSVLVLLMTVAMAVTFVAPWLSVRASSVRFSTCRPVILLLDQATTVIACGCLYFLGLRATEKCSHNVTGRVQAMKLSIVVATMTVLVVAGIVIYARAALRWHYPSWLVNLVGTWLDHA